MKPSVNESEGLHRFRLLADCHEVLHPIALGGQVISLDHAPRGVTKSSAWGEEKALPPKRETMFGPQQRRLFSRASFHLRLMPLLSFCAVSILRASKMGQDVASYDSGAPLDF